MTALRSNRAALLGVVIALAALAVALAVVLGGSEQEGADGDPARVTVDVGFLAGIPQDGFALGDPDAPVTLEEFADLQCPFCAEWASETMPALVDEYVKDGRLRVVFRNLAFLGADSTRGAHFAGAAALQGKLWQFVEAFFANQGEENSGYATDEFLRAIGEGIPGLDVDRAFAEQTDPAVDDALDTAERAAARYGFDSTPTFAIGRTGGKLAPMEISSLGPDEFRAAIDALLER